MPTPTQVDLDFLLDHAMLAQTQDLTRRFAGRGEQWRHPYAATQPVRRRRPSFGLVDDLSGFGDHRTRPIGVGRAGR